MTGLPKKYAKMGFAKGWRAYKASKRAAKGSRKYTSTVPRSNSGGHRMKKSGFQMVKGAAYAASLALPGIASYQNYKTYVYNGDAKASAIAAGKAYMGIDATTGKFSTAIAVQMYTPVAVVLAADVITSKTGLQRRIAKALNGIIG